MTDIPVATAAVAAWDYDTPAPKGTKILILTRSGVAIIGQWREDCHFLAWSPLPKRNKEREKELRA